MVVGPRDWHCHRRPGKTVLSETLPSSKMSVMKPRIFGHYFASDTGLSGLCISFLILIKAQPGQHYYPRLMMSKLKLKKFRSLTESNKAGKFQSLSVLKSVRCAWCPAVTLCVKTCLMTLNCQSPTWGHLAELGDLGRLSEPRPRIWVQSSPRLEKYNGFQIFSIWGWKIMHVGKPFPSFIKI